MVAPVRERLQSTRSGTTEKHLIYEGGLRKQNQVSMHLFLGHFCGMHCTYQKCGAGLDSKPLHGICSQGVRPQIVICLVLFRDSVSRNPADLELLIPLQTRDTSVCVMFFTNLPHPQHKLQIRLCHYEPSALPYTSAHTQARLDPLAQCPGTLTSMPWLGTAGILSCQQLSGILGKRGSWFHRDVSVCNRQQTP